MRYITAKGHQKDELIVTLEETVTYPLKDFYLGVKMSILTMRKEIWNIIQKKIAKVFGQAQVHGMGYYDLVSMLKFCNIFVDIGEDYSHCSSKM